MPIGVIEYKDNTRRRREGVAEVNFKFKNLKNLN
jgi:hypothetical protein